MESGATLRNSRGFRAYQRVDQHLHIRIYQSFEDEVIGDGLGWIIGDANDFGVETIVDSPQLTCKTPMSTRISRYFRAL